MPINAKFASLAIAAASVFAVVGVVEFSESDYVDSTNSMMGDAGLSRTTGSERTTDLLTGEVEPGGTVTTGVTLPLGARASDVIGPGTFDVVSFTHTDRKDGTWLEVVSRNTTDAPLRFVGFVTYTMGVE